MILQNTPRAGGWEEQRLCYGDNADAAHRTQRLPATSCNETQTAKLPVGRASCPPSCRAGRPTYAYSPVVGRASVSRESAERDSPSLPGVSGGVPLNLVGFPRAGGWEQPRPCCGEDADATHRAQRPPTTSCNEAQTAKGVIGRATCLPAGILPAELSERVQTVESSWSFR